MSDQPDFRGNQKLIVLRDLARSENGKLNEAMLISTLDIFGYAFDSAMIRTLLKEIEAAGAIRTTIAGGVIMVAEIIREGENHLEYRGTPIAGIPRPSRR